MKRLRPPVLLFESDRGRELRLFSLFGWAAVLGLMVGGIAMQLDDTMGGDGVATTMAGLFALIGAALWMDQRRRRYIIRILRLPEGLLFETTGLFGPLRRFVPQEKLGAIRVTEPDLSGIVRMKLPGSRAAFRLESGGRDVDLGLPQPADRRRRR